MAGPQPYPAEQLLQDPTTFDELTWIPGWACDPEAVDVTQQLLAFNLAEDDPWGPLPQDYAENYICGPAVWWCYCANAGLWSFFLIYPWIAIMVTECPESNAFVVIPGWVYLLYLPVLTFTLWCEFKCLRYVLPAQVAVVGAFRLPIVNSELSFGCWVALMVVLSIVAHMDIATNSLFLVKMLKAEWCLEGQNVPHSSNTIWREVMRQSTIPFLSTVSLAMVVLVSWLLMLAQPIYALLGSVPRSTRNVGVPVNYELKKEIIMKRAPFVGAPLYDTCLGEYRHHGHVVQVLAEAARMCSPTDQGPLHRNEMSTRGIEVDKYYHDEMKRMAVRFFVFFLCEIAIQPNLQASSLAVTMAATNGEDVDYQTVISIILSMLTGLKYLISSGVQMHQMWEVAGRAGEQARSTGEQTGTLPTLIVLIFLAEVIGGLACILYAAVKLYMALVVCPEAVWNLNGCVELP